MDYKNVKSLTPKKFLPNQTNTVKKTEDGVITTELNVATKTVNTELQNTVAFPNMQDYSNNL